MTKVKAR